MKKEEKMKAFVIMDSPVGELLLVQGEKGLEQLRFCSAVTVDRTHVAGKGGTLERPEVLPAGLDQRLGEYGWTKLMKETAAELEQYFLGDRRSFDIPLSPEGTEFQKLVWNALETIPYGETRSYGEIAALVNSPKACRAVGMANHQNPISILIPCHRVIGANGSLTGYGGGLNKKKWLLDLERKYCP